MKALNVKLLGAALLLAASSASAEWVVGLGAGLANSDTSVSALNDQLAAAGLTATVSATETRRETLQVFGDYRQGNWGGRLAYVNLGSISATINGTVQDVNAFAALAGDIHPLSARGWEADLLYQRPLTEQLSLLARVGFYRWWSDYDIGNATVSQSVSSSGTDPTFGLALEMPLGLELRGYAEWGRYLIVDEHVDLFGVGVGFAF